MSLFDKRADYKLVGVELPPHLHTFMSLYCVAKRESKSKLLERLIRKWLDESGETEKSLIREISKPLNKKWYALSVTQAYPDFQKFKKVVSEELLKKGLSEDQIILILSEIKEDGKN
jgi:hypothetical protein